MDIINCVLCPINYETYEILNKKFIIKNLWFIYDATESENLLK